MPQDPALCFLETLRQSRGDGCLQHDQLAEQVLLVPPSPSLAQNSFQTDGGRCGGDPDRTKLAKRSVVHHVVGHDIGGSSFVGEHQADFMGSQDTNASKNQDGSSSCVQSERGKLQEEGFSLDAVNLIQSSVSSGTTDQYVYKWKLFQTFCEEISVNPFNASEAVISNNQEKTET